MQPGQGRTIQIDLSPSFAIAPMASMLLRAARAACRGISRRPLSDRLPQVAAVRDLVLGSYPLDARRDPTGDASSKRRLFRGAHKDAAPGRPCDNFIDHRVDSSAGASNLVTDHDPHMPGDQENFKLGPAFSEEKVKFEEDGKFEAVDEDFASDTALWSLYERWCKHFHQERDYEEMAHRFFEFKTSALLVREVNNSDLSYKLRISEFSDGKLGESIFPVQRNAIQEDFKELEQAIPPVRDHVCFVWPDGRYAPCKEEQEEE